jgi:hypothetical protein
MIGQRFARKWTSAGVDHGDLSIGTLRKYNES